MLWRLVGSVDQRIGKRARIEHGDVTASPKRDRMIAAHAVEFGTGGKAPFGKLAIQEQVALSDDPLALGRLRSFLREHIDDLVDRSALRRPAIDGAPVSETSPFFKYR